MTEGRSEPAVAVRSALGTRWLDATDWLVLRGSELVELAERPGMGRITWFDGALGFLTLTAGPVGSVETSDVDEVADLLRPPFEASLHGLYQISEAGTYRWTAYLAPAGTGFVAAYSMYVDDHWELRVALVDRTVLNGLLIDLATVAPRIGPSERPDFQAEGTGTSATLTNRELEELMTLRGDSESALALLLRAGWDATMAEALAATVDLPLIAIEVQTSARLMDGTPSLGQHELWLSRNGWTWRIDSDPEHPLVTRYAPLDAMDTVTVPLRWLDTDAVR